MSTSTPILVGGVDTHTDTHTLALLSAQGRIRFTGTFPATRSGYQDLIGHLGNPERVPVVGVEGTNSYGAGLTRALHDAGFMVKEVLRPTRQVRRLAGKSDPIDAVAAARAVLADNGISEPKDTTGPAESLRFLLVSRESLVTSAKTLVITIKSLLITAPEDLRARYRGLSNTRLIEALGATRPRDQNLDDPAVAAAHALRHLAQTYQDLTDRADALEAQMTSVITEHYPAVLDIYGAGPITAARLVVTIGGNPDRVRNEAAFAQLCGAAPIPASSGKTVRHRLNRGGDRRGNRALHRIAIVRLRHDQRTKEYAAHRRAQGKTNPEIIRCLKRYIAREAYRALTHPTASPTGRRLHDLRTIREAHHLTQTQAAQALGVVPARISDIETQRRPLPDLTKRYHTWLHTLDTQ